MKEQFNKHARQIRYQQYLEDERNKHSNTKYQYKQFISERQHTVHLVLKFDFSNLNFLSMERMCNTLKAFDSRLHRKLLGPKWSKKPDQHTQWDAFAEKVTTHGHWHLLASVETLDIGMFVLKANESWKELRGVDKSENGVHADIIYDKYGLAEYVVKEFSDTHVNSLEFKVC